MHHTRKLHFQAAKQTKWLESISPKINIAPYICVNYEKKKLSGTENNLIKIITLINLKNMLLLWVEIIRFFRILVLTKDAK